MSPEDAEEYTQALGQVVAGGWRQVALGVRLGVPTALGLSTPDWVNDRLGGYVRLSIPDRREAVKELTAPVDEGGMGLSGRKAAEVLGVGHQTVGRDMADGPFGPDGSNRLEETNDSGGPNGPSANGQPTAGDLFGPDLPPPPSLAEEEKAFFRISKLIGERRLDPERVAEGCPSARDAEVAAKELSATVEWLNALIDALRLRLRQPMQVVK